MDNEQSGTLAVTHNQAGSRFEVAAEGMVSVLEYSISPGQIAFVHTGVPPQLEGNGIGTRLVLAGLNYARAQRLSVIPECPFVADFIRRYPEYGDLVKS